MNILITEPEYFDEECISLLKRLGTVKSGRFSKEQLESEIAATDIIVIRVETSLDKPMLSKAKNLKIIGTATTGLNHIDVEYATKNGIKIVSLKKTHTVPTAEFTFALILSLSRKIPWASASMKEGIWERHKFIGTQLQGKRLGIIGLGRIGSQVAAYANAFGLEVMAYDPYVKESEFKLVTIEEIIKGSDIITLHAELTKETENMLGEQQFRQMKRNALLINAARGGLVNKRALLDALANGTIAGAAIDVFDKEPFTEKDDMLLKYARGNDNLLLTPHLGASTKEAAHEAGIEIAKAIEDELKKAIE